ncbi:MAG TPA: hypothetical protein VKS01_08290 [Bryobacteraceae bacterium]|nr:hypothetical protein [Bryobacteraceae bacterium]
MLLAFCATGAERIDILLMNPSVSRTCPARVHFSGNIHPYQPGRVVYKFVRSDGAQGPELSMDFSRPEAKPISYDWQVGGHFTGWVQLVILAPNHEQTARREFSVNCR